MDKLSSAVETPYIPDPRTLEWVREFFQLRPHLSVRDAGRCGGETMARDFIRQACLRPSPHLNMRTDVALFFYPIVMRHESLTHFVSEAEESYRSDSMFRLLVGVAGQLKEDQDAEDAKPEVRAVLTRIYEWFDLPLAATDAGGPERAGDTAKPSGTPEQHRFSRLVLAGALAGAAIVGALIGHQSPGAGARGAGADTAPVQRITPGDSDP